MFEEDWEEEEEWEDEEEDFEEEEWQDSARGKHFRAFSLLKFLDSFCLDSKVHIYKQPVASVSLTGRQ